MNDTERVKRSVGLCGDIRLHRMAYQNQARRLVFDVQQVGTSGVWIGRIKYLHRWLMAETQASSTPRKGAEWHVVERADGQAVLWVDRIGVYDV